MRHPGDRLIRSLLAPSALLALSASLAGGCRTATVKVDDTSTTNVTTDSSSDTDTHRDSSGDTSDSGDTSIVVQGDLSVSPAAITLATIFVGQHTSADLTLTNVGTGNVSATLSVVGGWATSYTLGAYTASLAPAESTTDTLTLTPTAWGDDSVSIIIDSDSGAHIEVPITALVQEDADGDGHGSIESRGDDCNDADASIYTGATDAWYDGIDSDCAGNDDYDQDGDGVDSTAADGGTDCNDTDPTIYPGAPDAWYDGIDSDCAGNDDYDQDGDGYVPTADVGLPTAGVVNSGHLHGNDCDDTNPAINPRASDVWYDGIDSDCAGNDDYDQDADGHDALGMGADGLGDDCDDTNPTVYPGATDTWYDGIDSNCDGADDYDQDGDGVDYPTDCNDTDPTVTGPVAETMNGIDDDCNGVIDDFVVSDVATGVLYGTVASMGLGEHGTMAMTDDVTGDGAADLIVGTRYYVGYTYVVGGATASTANGLVTDYDTATISGDSYYYQLGLLNGPFADEDGDGVTDFVIGAAYNSTTYSYYGRSMLYTGGSNISGAFTVGDTNYQARFSGDSYYDNAGQSAIGDVDGDGIGDVVVGSWRDESSDSTSDSGSVAFFVGGSLSGDLDLGDADDRIYGSNSNDYLGYSLTMADVNGDGYDDAIAGAPGYDGTSSSIGAVYIFSGNSAAGWGSKADSAAAGFVTGSSREMALGTDTLWHPGDLDGDGNIDLALTSEDNGEVWVFMDAQTIDSTTSVTSANHILTGTAGDMGSMVVMDSDLDNDGLDDLVVGADGDNTNGSNSGTVYVFSNPSTWGSSMTSADAVATFYGTAAEEYLGTGGTGGKDVTGDGIADLVIGASSDDTKASGAGAVWVVPGW